MKINVKELNAELIEKTRLNINKAESFKNLSIDQLNFKTSPESWSVLECIEHLNIYGNYYNPEIKKCLEKSKTKANVTFKPGVIGNYFVNLMKPKAKLNKMKTLADNNPIGSKLNIEVIDHFINQQKVCLELINESKQVDLTKTKTGISISKMIKLRLGDTLRFIVTHNERHLLQAENVLK